MHRSLALSLASSLALGGCGGATDATPAPTANTASAAPTWGSLVFDETVQIQMPMGLLELRPDGTVTFDALDAPLGRISAQGTFVDGTGRLRGRLLPDGTVEVDGVATNTRLVGHELQEDGLRAVYFDGFRVRVSGIEEPFYAANLTSDREPALLFAFVMLSALIEAGEIPIE